MKQKTSACWWSIFYVICVCLRTVVSTTLGYTRHVSYKRQELLTIRKYLGSLPVFGGVRIAQLISFCVLFVFVLCLVWLMLPVSLDCPFLIAPAVSSWRLFRHWYGLLDISCIDIYSPKNNVVINKKQSFPPSGDLGFYFFQRFSNCMVFQSFDQGVKSFVLHGIFNNISAISWWWVLLVSFDNARIWWRLFQKHVVRIKLDIYVFLWLTLYTHEGIRFAIREKSKQTKTRHQWSITI